MTKYNQALKETGKYLYPPIRFSNYQTPKEDSNVVIRQSNTIKDSCILYIIKLEKKEISKSPIIRDKNIQLVRQRFQTLTLFSRLKYISDDIDNLDDVIDVYRDMERCQRNTLRSLRPEQLYQMGIFVSRNRLYRISREIELCVLTRPDELRTRTYPVLQAPVLCETWRMLLAGGISHTSCNVQRPPLDSK